MKQDGDKMWWGIWPNKVFQRKSWGMAVFQSKTALSIEEGYWQCGSMFEMRGESVMSRWDDKSHKSHYKIFGDTHP